MIFTYNVNVQQGAANGASGVICKFHWQEDATPQHLSAISVTLDDSKEVVKVYRTKLYSR